VASPWAAGRWNAISRSPSTREDRHCFQNVRANLAYNFARKVAQQRDFSCSIACIKVAWAKPPHRQTEHFANHAHPGARLSLEELSRLPHVSHSLIEIASFKWHGKACECSVGSRRAEKGPSKVSGVSP
jgi:hypothetical protein